MRIIVLAIVMLLSGCMSVIGSVAKVASVGMFPDSGYIVPTFSESDVDKQKKIYDENPKTVIKDQYGKFYFEPVGSETGVTTFRNDDYDVLNSAFSKGRGVLMPLIVIDSSGSPVPDWSETEKTIDNMRKSLRLNIVNVDVSKRVWEKILSTRVEAVARGGLMDHNLFVMNNSVYELALKSFEGSFEYVVFSPAIVEGVFNNKGRYKFVISASVEDKLLEWSYYQFASMEYFKNLKEGGSYRFYSLCGKFNSVYAKQRMRLVGSRKSFVLQGRPAAEFNKSIIKRNQEVVEACRHGFKAIGIEGYSSSSRLR